MMDSSIPKTFYNLRGFLGLIGYYSMFIRNYGRIEASVTKITKKDAFSWTLDEGQAFEQLKEEICKDQILTTLNFTKAFVVECHSSENVIGDVLMQEGRPISFQRHPIE